MMLVTVLPFCILKRKNIHGNPVDLFCGLGQESWEFVMFKNIHPDMFDPHEGLIGRVAGRGIST